METETVVLIAPLNSPVNKNSVYFEDKEGNTAKVDVVYYESDDPDLDRIIELVKNNDPSILYIVEDGLNEWLDMYLYWLVSFFDINIVLIGEDKDIWITKQEQE